MKKYILLAGVAFATMTASNVMAGTYSDITVKANIEKYSQISCTDLDFGTIKILPSASLAAGAAGAYSNPTEATVTVGGGIDGASIVTLGGATVDDRGFGIMSVTGTSRASCDWLYHGVPETVTLKNGDSTLTVSDFTSDTDYGLGATLTIPDVMTVEEGEYTGAFTLYREY